MRSDRFPGLSVHLQVNGVNMEEFEDPESPDGVDASVTRYVEAAAGAIFSIQLSLGSNIHYAKEDHQYVVSLDKVVVVQCLSISRERQLPSVTVCRGKRELFHGNWIERRFAFASLCTTDGPAPTTLTNTVAGLGEVTVDVILVQVGGQDFGVRSSRSLAQPALAKGIPEKALKGRAISQYATLINPTPTTAPNHRFTTYHRGEAPVATFKFKYRSHSKCLNSSLVIKIIDGIKEDLQIEGIIERSPSPIPLEERDIDTLNAEEMRELLRRSRVARQESVRMKQESIGVKREAAPTVIDDSSDDDDQVEIVQRLGSDTNKRRRIDHGDEPEVVDLTED